MSTGQFPQRRESDRAAKQRAQKIRERAKKQEEQVYQPNRAERRMMLKGLPRKMRMQLLGREPWDVEMWSRISGS